MKTLLVAAAAAMAACLSLSQPSQAADLGYELTYEDEDVSAQVVSHKRQHPNYYYNSYRPVEPVYANPPPGDDPYNDPALYNGEAPNDDVVDDECVSRQAIRARLKEQGWRNFHGLAMNPDVIGITASRPNGLVYRLKMDRCSGVIMSSYLLDQPARKAASRRNRNYGY